MVRKLTSILEPGGTLCLIDLDYNCLTHYELDQSAQDILDDLMAILENKYNFDPYVGRKLYTYLYDLGYQHIQVKLEAHPLIYGDIESKDLYNWMKKIEILADNVPEAFGRYPGGAQAFYSDMKSFLKDQRRFTYTPLILCRGIRS
jgi:hypothetical protein